MKNLIIVFCLVFYASFCSFGQQLRYRDFNTDKKPKGSFKSYISKDGAVYHIGDTLKIGYPSFGASFAFIYVENGFLEIAAGQSPKPLDIAERDIKLQIKKIWIGGTKKRGFYALIKSKVSAGWLAEIYTIELENAIEQCEIQSVPSTDRALSEM